MFCVKPDWNFQNNTDSATNTNLTTLMKEGGIRCKSTAEFQNKVLFCPLTFKKALFCPQSFQKVHFCPLTFRKVRFCPRTFKKGSFLPLLFQVRSRRAEIVAARRRKVAARGAEKVLQHSIDCSSSWTSPAVVRGATSCSA